MTTDNPSAWVPEQKRCNLIRGIEREYAGRKRRGREEVGEHLRLGSVVIVRTVIVIVRGPLARCWRRRRQRPPSPCNTSSAKGRRVLIRSRCSIRSLTHKRLALLIGWVSRSNQLRVSIEQYGRRNARWSMLTSLRYTSIWSSRAAAARRSTSMSARLAS